MKRIFSLIILVSMLLHSASRLGVISFLFQKRHDIAYHIGIIAEIPIAMCSSDYDFRKVLHFQDHDTDESLLVGFSQAREIQLFIQVLDLDFIKNSGILEEQPFALLIEANYFHQPKAIFHPPCEA